MCRNRAGQQPKLAAQIDVAARSTDMLRLSPVSPLAHRIAPRAPHAATIPPHGRRSLHVAQNGPLDSDQQSRHLQRRSVATSAQQRWQCWWQQQHRRASSTTSTATSRHPLATDSTPTRPTTCSGSWRFGRATATTLTCATAPRAPAATRATALAHTTATAAPGTATTTPTPPTRPPAKPQRAPSSCMRSMSQTKDQVRWWLAVWSVQEGSLRVRVLDAQETRAPETL